ncbi:hypothetical protein C8N33_102364 [Pararhodobacter aggregans]|nr:hypothetical protein C8N33_102364 [Pararhodobacter aggregans]
MSVALLVLLLPGLLLLGTPLFVVMGGRSACSLSPRAMPR